MAASVLASSTVNQRHGLETPPHEIPQPAAAAATVACTNRLRLNLSGFALNRHTSPFQGASYAGGKRASVTRLTLVSNQGLGITD